MHDEPTTPPDLPSDDAPTPDGGAPTSKGPLGSVAFALLLATVAFLLWQAFAGGGSGPC